MYWLLLGINGGVIRSRRDEYVVGAVNHRLCDFRESRTSVIILPAYSDRVVADYLGWVLVVVVSMVV